MRTIIALTGASGAAVGVEFIKRCPGEKYLIVSRWGRSVLYQETGLRVEELSPFVNRVFSSEDMNAPFASGSTPFDRYVILPCSMTTLARIAAGLGENLIARVGEVALKENRRMLLGIRETPLSAIALENCLKLARLGVTIMPLSPAFYMKPQTPPVATPQEMIDCFVDHVLTSLHLPSQPGWRENVIASPPPRAGEAIS